MSRDRLFVEKLGKGGQTLKFALCPTEGAESCNLQ